MKAYCIYFSWALVVSFVDGLAVVPPFLFGLWFCSSLSWAVFRVWRVGGFRLVSAGSLVAAGEGVVMLLFVLQFFVLFLALSAVAFALLSGWRSCSWLSRWLPWVGCGVVLASACSSFLGFVFEELVFGIFFDFAVAVFLRVAGCPPGGEICGMYF